MKKRGLFILAGLLMLGVLIGYLSFCKIETKKIPPIIRLHILANSDSAEDQALKYRVRDWLINTMGTEFAESPSIEEARALLQRRLPYIEALTARYLAQEGYPFYQVKAVYGTFLFPSKDYGAFVLPAGEYEALRLIIGEGKGANWWCVLFPPLCFVEGEESLCLEKDFEEMLEITEAQGKKVEIKPALKVVEICKEIFG